MRNDEKARQLSHNIRVFARRQRSLFQEDAEILHRVAGRLAAGKYKQALKIALGAGDITLDYINRATEEQFLPFVVDVEEEIYECA